MLHVNSIAVLRTIAASAGAALYAVERIAGSFKPDFALCLFVGRQPSMRPTHRWVHLHEPRPGDMGGYPTIPDRFVDCRRSRAGQTMQRTRRQRTAPAT